MAEREFLKMANTDPDRYYLKCPCGKRWDMGTVTEVGRKERRNFNFCSYCGRKFDYDKVVRGDGRGDGRNVATGVMCLALQRKQIAIQRELIEILREFVKR